MKDDYRHREKMDIQIEGSYPQPWDSAVVRAGEALLGVTRGY